VFSKNIILIISFIFCTIHIVAQKDSVIVKKHLKVKKQKKFKNKSISYDPLKPSKAAFYSAIFPGMGQIYNKKYWKTPIVWGALAIPAYYYTVNSKDYNRYRKAFKLREAGFQDEFTLDDGTERLSSEGLISAQKQLRKNRDLSLFSAILLYVLQIVEASVNAHLLQFNTSDNLSFQPAVITNKMQFDTPKIGLSLKYSF